MYILTVLGKEEKGAYSVIKDAVDALATLGYKKTEAKNLVNTACNGRIFKDVSELLKATMSRTNV